MPVDFCRCYLSDVMDKLDREPMPGDILQMSSETICDLIGEFADAPLPDWCRTVSWNEYADHRYERPARRLAALLGPDNYRKTIADSEQRRTLQGDSVVVWEKADAFGRTSLKAGIPDFLYDDTSSVGDTFVLWRKQTEEFLNTWIGPPGFRWPWKS